jgi:hypothetical protein
LREFEQDLHQHIHLENNILFPRATDLEAASAWWVIIGGRSSIQMQVHGRLGAVRITPAGFGIADNPLTVSRVINE